MRGKRQTASIGALLAVLAVSGCSGGGTTKAGGDVPPITLRIGTDDSPDKPGAKQIDEFASQVKRLSNGDITIEPVYRAVGVGTPDWDQRVAEKVVEGDLDMGMIPARAWDTEGVTSLRALHAPFLVTNDELLAQVVSGDLADDMLAGLTSEGVVGLALLPEGLRHPFGFAAPLLSAADYAGKVMRTPTSATASAIFSALGATTTDQLNVASQAGMESSYFQDTEGTATGNVTLYPKANSMVVNAAAFASLSEDQQGVLERAAEETRDQAIATLPDDAAAAVTYCDSGYAVVLASQDDLAGLEQATRSVYADLERDATTKTLIGQIRQLKDGTRDVAPTPCGSAAAGTGASAAPSAPAGDASTLNGVYRFEVTDDELIAAGIDADDTGLINENHGVFTWTLTDGRFCTEQQAPNALAHPSACGTYVVDGPRMVTTYPDGQHEAFRWTVEAGGALRLEVDGPPIDATTYAWVAEPWTKIG